MWYDIQKRKRLQKGGEKCVSCTISGCIGIINKNNNCNHNTEYMYKYLFNLDSLLQFSQANIKFKETVQLLKYFVLN